MTIKQMPKFSIGQDVWLKERRLRDTPCKTCDATGKVKLKGDDFDCPACGGDGSRFVEVPILRKYCVAEIAIGLQHSGVTTVKYRLPGYGTQEWTADWRAEVGLMDFSTAQNHPLWGQT